MTKELPTFAMFPNGTSHMLWCERNCDRCVKGPKDANLVNGVNTACAIENEISFAAATDGTLLHGGSVPINRADAIAKRLNWDGESYLQHDCPEFVP